MIDPISYRPPEILLSKDLFGKTSTNQSRSPFEDLLLQEITPSKPLDALILNFLIKTIRSICSTPLSGDSFPLLPSLPIFSGGPSPAMPKPEKPSPETDVPPSVLKSGSRDFDNIIRHAADEFGVDPALIKAVISVESNGNPRAVSPAGAQGLMQLMPKTAAELGVTNPFDPIQNIRAGSRYLSQLQRRYQGDLKLTLAAYNWGMGNLEHKPESLPRETRNYILQVEKRYLAFADFSAKA